MNEAERKPKITLEQLLQVKRTERPAADFWPRFEGELRTKQLAALVQPVRPWWRGFASRRVMIRVYAPLGAAAVVALSFSSFSRDQAQRVTVAVAQPSPAVVQQALPEAGAAVSATQAGVENSPPVLAAVQAEQPVADRDSKQEIVAESVATTTTAPSPEQLLLAGTATMKAAGYALAHMVGLTDSASDIKETVRNDLVEPLAQLTSPRDSRRARLLAYSVAYDPHAAVSKDATRSRERITRRISDESIYDSISRLGVSGDRVSIKF